MRAKVYIIHNNMSKFTPDVNEVLGYTWRVPVYYWFRKEKFKNKIILIKCVKHLKRQQYSQVLLIVRQYSRGVIYGDIIAYPNIAGKV